MDESLNRRNFLLMIGGSVAGVAASPPGHIAGAAQGHIQMIDPHFGSTTFDQPIITARQDFFAHSYKGSIPAINIADWSLSIDGLVDARTFTLNHLRGLPAVEDLRTIACIGNPVGGSMIANARFRGLRFADLLHGIRPEATHVKFSASDGYQTAVPLEYVMHPDTILAYEMNSEPLSAEHGYPLRMLIPGVYGQKMPKWITNIEFIDYPFQGYWESHGWSDAALVKTHAIIISPRERAQIDDGIAVQGVAFAGLRDITNVEIRVDGGEWMAANLLHGPSSLMWTQWYLDWLPEALGTFAIEARATDSDGFTQHEDAPPPFSSRAGTSGIHRIIVEVI
jgi:DMSO/TMAO reductase YedYZ molybdopterin-dependent catalytic subunit